MAPHLAHAPMRAAAAALGATARAAAARSNRLPSVPTVPRQVTGDFDPEEYDRQMAAAFGSEYYDAVRPGCCSGTLAGCWRAAS